MPLWLQIELALLPFGLMLAIYFLRQDKRMTRLEVAIVNNRRASRNLMLRIFPEKAAEIVADEERDIHGSGF